MYFFAALIATANVVASPAEQVPVAAPLAEQTPLDKKKLGFEEEILAYENPDELKLQEIVVDETQEDLYSDPEDED